MIPDDAPSIGVALLGFGFAGRIFHAPFIATTPGLELRVVASRRGEIVTTAYPGAQVVASPDAAIGHRDVDLVVVATPNHTHAALAEIALRAGRHAVVDKPFTVSGDIVLHLAGTGGGEYCLSSRGGRTTLMRRVATDSPSC